MNTLTLFDMTMIPPPPPPCTCCNPEACDACPPCPACRDQRIWTFAFQFSDMPKPELNALRNWRGDKSYWTYFDAVSVHANAEADTDVRVWPVQRITDPIPET